MTQSRPARWHLEAAAEWGASFRLGDAPADIVELAKLQIANLMAAMVAGSRSGAGRRAYAAMRPTLTPGPCTLMLHGERVSLWDALWLHAVYANALELDDFHYQGHVAPATVLVPLALAEMHSLDGASILRAQIVASELGGRLGWAIDAEIRGGHLRSYQVRFAAAAAAGVLLGLDARQLTMALAIAMTQPETPLHRGMFSPDTKALSAAPSVVEGVRAALLAAEGFNAARDILEDPSGFYRQFSFQRHTPTPFIQLGEAWSTHALSFKRYAACAYASGAVDAAREVRADPNLDVGAIDRIEIATTLPALIMERLARPHVPGELTPVNVQFSLARSVSLALVLGDVRGTAFAPSAFAESVGSVAALSAKASLHHDWAFTIHQLKGIDAGLNNGGGTRGTDMIQLYRTSRAFRAMFGSVRSIGPRDILPLLRLPAEDRRYFARRWMRSASSHIGSMLSASDGDDSEQRPLGDLRRLSYRMGARVTVTLRGGRRITRERVIPTGMAGDPDRAAMIREKLDAEMAPVFGLEQVSRIWEAIMDVDNARTVNIASLMVEHSRAAVPV